MLIRGVDLFRIYDYVKVMTDGGPGTATETLTSYAGTIYFKHADFPYASTIALFTLILVIVTSSLFIKLFGCGSDAGAPGSRTVLRDIAAMLVVGLFMFPMFWWALTSIKPTSAIFNKDEVVFFDFVPTLRSTTPSPCSASRASELAIERRQYLRRRRRQLL